MTDHVTVNDQDATRIITMRRPEKKNALTPGMYRAMAEAIDSAQQDTTIRCLIITGTAGVFTSGNDLNEFLDIGTAGGEAALNSVGAAAFLQSLLHNAKPLVAAVDGLAIGIGTTMVFHCDYVIASKAAIFSTPFVGLGLVPEGASSLLGPHLLGHQRAFSLLVMGRPLDGEEAQQAGFVNQVVPAGHAEVEARKVAREICALPAEAVAISKRLLRLPVEMIEDRFALEAKHFGEQIKTDEAIHAFKAFMARKKLRA